MTTLIRVLGGTYNIRGNPVDVSDTVFEMTKGYAVGAQGGYVTVDGRSADGFPEREIRIKCPGEDAVVLTNGESISDNSIPIVAKPVETDEQIMQRIGERFEMLEQLTQVTKNGGMKALIVTGAAGVGKSHGVETVLARSDTVSLLSDTPPTYEFVKGTISAIGLYQKLWQFKESNNILVFDDCDSVFYDDVCLNILKAALDSKKSRNISWNTESRVLEAEKIPNTFEFKGSVIFITNIKFENVRSNKLRAHLEAIESRCHYMDLTIDTTHEKILRIRQVVRNNMLDGYKLSSDTKEDIVNYVDDNKERLRELSLRTVTKIADLAVAFPSNWQRYAESTVMKT